MPRSSTASPTDPVSTDGLALDAASMSTASGSRCSRSSLRRRRRRWRGCAAAASAIGVDDGRLTEATAAGLVGAGMLSVLLFPLLATRVRGVTTPPVGGWADASDAL